MTLRQFFKKLQFYYEGVDVKGIPYAVKVYIQINTFSYDIYKGTVEENVVYFNFLEKEIYRSGIFDNWLYNYKKIIEDIEKNFKQL